MKKSDIEKELSRKFNLNSVESRKVLDVIIDAMTRMLRDGERIEIRHFGSFFTKNYQPYEGRNPRTGEKIYIGEKTLPLFRVSNWLAPRLTEKHSDK